MTTTSTRPTPTTDSSSVPSGRRGLAARISLGRVFTPLPVEFLLILSTALLLTAFGLVMVLSATSANASPFDFFLKQGIFALIGIPVMLIFSRLPVGFWKRMAWPALILATAFQLLVFSPLGYTDVDHANRNWIKVFGIQAQPSEFLKLALALWLGYVLYRKQTLLGLWRHVYLPVVPVSAAVIATVMAGKDLGTAMIIALVVLGALYFSGVKLRVFILPLLGGIAFVAFYALTSADRLKRIGGFLNPQCETLKQISDYACYQPVHGVWALASGGVFGLGLGNSKLKYGWLPAASSDYIFAIVGEELGLIGCGVLLTLIALFAVGVFHIIRKTDDPFVRIASGGIVVWIVGQALINIAVVLRLFPVLGIPLPFVSQGGTSLLSVLMATGVLLSFARTLPRRDAVLRTAQEPASRAR